MSLQGIRIRLQWPFGLIILLLSATLYGQTITPSDIWKVDSLVAVTSDDYAFHLPATHWPYWQSLNIEKNGLLLQTGADYRIYDERLIRFFPPPDAGDTLRIQYKRMPFKLKRQYRLFNRQNLSKEDSLIKNQKSDIAQRIQFENPFKTAGASLKTSGSIMRGIQVGSNRDFTLNSGLNVELSGMITDDIEIIGALTDEATPIQPEGNTQTLEEIDKVFIQFRSPYIDGTVGDFNIEKKQTSFANVSRKLQGITLRSDYNENYLGATIAATRGYFNRMQFLGQEGNQGPYQLTGRNEGSDIIVLTGTERVYINGERMVRGESNDYVIEYGSAQITFTSNRLITSESRIEIDFEYFPAVQQYNRNVYGIEGGAKVFDDEVGIHMRYFREADNPDQLLEEGGAIRSEEKAIIEQAGDNPLNAVRSGATLRSDSSASYVKTDTTLNGRDYTIYRYVGDKNGNYSVVFSFIGKNAGSYVRTRLGVYRWVGPQNGNYEPVRLLPLPVSHDVTDLRMAWQPSNQLELSAEAALTRRDQNRLSSLDDNDNNGASAQIGLKLRDTPLKYGGNNLGRLSWQLNARYIDSRFQAVDRINRPDYQRLWNIPNELRDESAEMSVHSTMDYFPRPYVQWSLEAGELHKKGLDSRRWRSELQLDKPDWLRGGAQYELVNSAYAPEDNEINWQRYRAHIQRPFWKIEPKLFYEGEHRRNQQTDRLTGFRFNRYGGELQLINWQHIGGSIQSDIRLDDVYDYEQRNQLLPQAETRTDRLAVSLKNLERTSASLQITRRSKDYTEYFERIKIDTLKLRYADAALQDTIWQDRNTNLAELKVSHHRWKKALDVNTQYRISTQQTALKEKVYINVGEGRGNLRFDEDLEEYVPDPDGTHVLFVLPSDQFEPVTEVQSALRLRFDPDRYWERPVTSLQKLLTKISGESYFRVEEETKEPDVQSIYLLDLSKFQQNQTLRGVMQYNQDLYFLRRNRTISFRLRYRFNQSRFNQYLDAGENEDRKQNRFAFRTDWRITPKLRSLTEAASERIRRVSRASPLRNRNITGYYVDQKWSYRPFTRWEFGLESEYGNERNDTGNYPLDLWYLVLKSRVDYAIPGKGRISGEYTRQTVRITDNPLDYTVPYEMARGKKAGLSQSWHLRAEYTVAKNIVFTFFYSGRDEPHFDRIIHSGQAEIRAFF